MGRRMGSRRGVLLLETVLALLILAAMAGAAMPMISHGVEVLTTLTLRMRLQEEGLFASEYMTDRIRCSLTRSTKIPMYTSDVYAYRDYDQNGNRATYQFYPDKEVWYLKLYTGRSQPLTGDRDLLPAYGVGMGRRSYFTVWPGGLVMISYQMKHKSGETFDVETAILPLYDYFQQGEAQGDS